MGNPPVLCENIKVETFPAFNQPPSEGRVMTELSPTVIWMLAGALMIALEIMALPGIGFLFAGLGALTVGVCLMLGVIVETIPQFSVFFIATAIWTAILWKPIKKMMRGKDSGFSDMVGSTAVVFGDALQPGKYGQVKWSGTIMKCELQSSGNDGGAVEPGTEVTITRVEQGVLHVKVK